MKPIIQFSSLCKPPAALTTECRHARASLDYLFPAGIHSDEDLLRYMYVFPGQLADDCPFLTDDYYKYLFALPQSELDQLNPYLEDKRLKQRPKFGGSWIHIFYTLTCDFGLARQAQNYACIRDMTDASRSLGKQLSLTHLFHSRSGLFRSAEEAKKRCLEFYPRRVESSSPTGYHDICENYQHLKNFQPFQDLIEKAETALPQEIKKRESEQEYNHRHSMLINCIDEYIRLFLFYFVLGRVDEARAVWQEYFELYEWDQARTKPFNYEFWVEGNRYLWRPIVGAIYHWFQARDYPEKREAGAREAMKHFYNWIIRDQLKCKYGGTTFLSKDLMLPMLMRIDLGLETSICREFLRYYKPYFMSNPEIWQKVQALNVEYVAPVAIPDEELLPMIEQIHQSYEPGRRRIAEYRHRVIALKDRLNYRKAPRLTPELMAGIAQIKAELSPPPS